MTRRRKLHALTVGQRKLLRDLAVIRPRDAGELHALVRRVLALRVPRRAVMPGSDAPFDYLAHAFFEGEASGDQALGLGGGDSRVSSGGGADCVVWASRGGGKTYLGAVATLLDLLFKPGISVRILGGSLEQSARMFAYLREMVDRPVLRLALKGEPTQRRMVLVNGSEVQVLAQSQRSVRGVRVHKLRCDEVEEFDERVWEAAQLVTRSGRCGPVEVTGSVEAISTMHRPYGLMSKLVEREGVKVFRWSALDVMERCPADRPCQTCVLWSDCGGRAKEAQGFVSVDEMVRLWQRSSSGTWSAEMLCERPQTQHQVFARFDATVGGPHVMEVERLTLGEDAELIGGMDFGLRNPLAMVWARVSPSSGVRPQALQLTRGEGDARQEVQGRLVEVVDVYVAQGLTLGEHLERMAGRGLPRPTWVGVDPAGGARSAQTGVSDIDVLRRTGLRVRAVRSAIPTGLEIIRRRLDRGTLRIAANCEALIQAMSQYHYAADRPGDEMPVKDGPDHVCDALRYMLVNLELGGGGGGVRVRGY